MHERTGFVKHITKSWEGGGRSHPGYVVIVSIPGDDIFEVGLSALRRIIGWNKLTPERVNTLMRCKPEFINFKGKYIELDYGGYNALQITDDSAHEWADRLNIMNNNCD